VNGRLPPCKKAKKLTRRTNKPKKKKRALSKLLRKTGLLPRTTGTGVSKHNKTKSIHHTCARGSLKEPLQESNPHIPPFSPASKGTRFFVGQLVSASDA